MIVYMVFRVCQLHSRNGNLGPPIALYFTQNLAEKRVFEWKESHPWDTNEYLVKPMTVRGDAELYNGEVAVLIKGCPLNDHYREDVDCGPAIGLYVTPDLAAQCQKAWSEKSPYDTSHYHVKVFPVRGERRKACSFAATLNYFRRDTDKGVHND